MLSILFMLAQAAANAQAAPVQPAGQDKPIVVYGYRLETSKRELAECIARACPPVDDVNATLAHAENQFMAGDYAGARDTVRASRKRNGRFQKSSPIAVAELTRVDARLASLNGEATSARITTIDALDILKSGLMRDHPRVLRQLLEVADIFARQGRLDAAAGIYDEVAGQARAAAIPAVEGEALFRSAALYSAAASLAPQYRQSAERAVRQIEKTTDPALAPFRQGVTLLKARLALLSGKQDQANALIARIPPSPGKPILLFSPPIRLDTVPSGSSVVPEIGDGRPQWVDVQFVVSADGRVGNVEVIRQSPTVAGNWFGQVRKSLENRRYAPLHIGPDGDGAMQIERFSYVRDRAATTASRLRSPAANGRIDVTDLTFEPARPKPAT